MLRRLMDRLRRQPPRWWWSSPSALQVFTDGSSAALPGKAGGWAFVVVKSDQAILTGTGGERASTSTRMELQAALSGLEAVLSRGWHQEGPVELVSDSKMALDVANGSDVPTRDAALCGALRAACLSAGASTQWVRGHSGVAWNERVDLLAREAKHRMLPARLRRRVQSR